MELYDLTVHEIMDNLRKKEASAKEVTEATFHRIANVESTIKAYISLCEEKALDWADKVDQQIGAGEGIPDLAGVPMALKDNICTKNILTTCASKMLENFIPPYNATVVKKIYAQKSVLIGKTNMDEFAMGSSTEHSAFHITKNPWNISCVSGGSSGGSAAAVASGEAFFALGSDTGGSIRQPASFCGLVGLKPTYGLVSRYGLIAYASSFDQIGPLTKDVEDCALVMNGITGHDKMDMTSVNRGKIDYKKALVRDIKGMKIGVIKEIFQEKMDKGVRQSILRALERLKDMGGIIEEASIPHIKYSLPAYYIMTSSECSSNLARFDGIRYGYRAKEYTDIKDLFMRTRSEGFGEEVKRRIMLGTYALGAGYYEEYYQHALKIRTLIKNDFEKAFKKFDVLITPTTLTTAFKLQERTENPLDMYLSDICTVPANIAGVPAISICCGFQEGLPIGMQIIGKPFNEGTLLRIAYTYEKSTDYHKKRPKL
ncbi:Asp-tRNA(Asn)/Glu-tRNA(Gln) amidotransferase subunit GatA [Clostridiaceae bacterium 35-E11]